MSKINKKGEIPEILITFISFTSIILTLIVFFGFFVIKGEFNLDIKSANAISATDITLIHITYLNSPYLEGTVGDQIIKISMEQDARKRGEELENLRKYTEDFIKLYPAIELNQYITKEQTKIEIPDVASESREQAPTLSERTAFSTITIPTPEGDIKHTFRIFNIYHIDQESQAVVELEAPTL